MKSVIAPLAALALAAAAFGIAPRFGQNADTVLLNGKIVTLDAAAHGGRGARRARRQASSRSAASRRYPRAREAKHARDRPAGPHRHSRPDRLAHARDPRRAVLRTEVNWIGATRDPRGDGAHQGRAAQRGEARAMDHRRRRLDRAAVRGEAAADAGRAARRRAGQPGLRPAVLQRGVAHARRLQGAQHHRRCGRAAARQDRARRRRHADRLDPRRQPHHQRPVRQAAAADIRRERGGHAGSSSASSTGSASPASAIPAAST